MNPVDQFIATGLDAGATALEADKAAIVAAATTPVDNTLDSAVKALEGGLAASTHGFAAFIVPTVDHVLDQLDTGGKAVVPTELGALIDYVVAEARALAAKLQAA